MKHLIASALLATSSFRHADALEIPQAGHRDAKLEGIAQPPPVDAAVVLTTKSDQDASISSLQAKVEASAQAAEVLGSWCIKTQSQEDFRQAKIKDLREHNPGSTADTAEKAEEGFLKAVNGFCRDEKDRLEKNADLYRARVTAKKNEEEQKRLKELDEKKETEKRLRSEKIAKQDKIAKIHQKLRVERRKYQAAKDLHDEAERKLKADSDAAKVRKTAELLEQKALEEETQAALVDIDNAYKTHETLAEVQHKVKTGLKTAKRAVLATLKQLISLRQERAKGLSNVNKMHSLLQLDIFPERVKAARWCNYFLSQDGSVASTHDDQMKFDYQFQALEFLERRENYRHEEVGFLQGELKKIHTDITGLAELKSKVDGVLSHHGKDTIKALLDQRERTIKIHEVQLSHLTGKEIEQRYAEEHDAQKSKMETARHDFRQALSKVEKIKETCNEIKDKDEFHVVGIN